MGRILSENSDKRPIKTLIQTMLKCAPETLGDFHPKEESFEMGQIPSGACYVSTTGTNATEYSWNQISNVK